MRTTISIDDDVLERARAVATKLRTPFKTVINEALRAGLEHVELPAKLRRYRTKPHSMGLKAGRNIDNIQGLLAQMQVKIPVDSGTCQYSAVCEGLAVPTSPAGTPMVDDQLSGSEPVCLCWTVFSRFHSDWDQPTGLRTTALPQTSPYACPKLV
jgi:hypothetical protein